MPLTKRRKQELRLLALSRLWQILDSEVTNIAVTDGYQLGTDAEHLFIQTVIDTKAQAAFNEYQNYKDKLTQKG